MSYIPIGVRRVAGVNAAFPDANRYFEAITQTFKVGVPVQFSGGYVQECATIDDASPTDMILGFSMEPGSNLATVRVPKTLTTGQTPPNQSSAVIIPIGAPPNDAMVGVVLATDNVEFFAATVVGHALAATDVGSQFGLTKDGGTGQWYVDTAKTAVGDGACVIVTELIDPIGTDGGRVAFRVSNNRQQLQVAG